MASVKTKLAVGLFVIFGFAIAFVAIIWIGMLGYFEKGQNYAAYFDESVQGLEKDSPVKYRGVSIGRVESIAVAPDAKLIQVVIKIEKELKLDMYYQKIVAQLKSVGITGIMFIELDHKKDSEPDLSPQLTFPSKYPEIATKPSDITKLMKGIEDVVRQLNSMDIGGITKRLKESLDNINQAIEDVQLREISSNIISSLERVEKILGNKTWNKLIQSVESAGNSFKTLTANANKTVTGINKTVARLDGVVAENEKELAEAIFDFKRLINNANSFLEEGSELIKDGDAKFSSLQQHLTLVLQNFEAASDNLNRLIDALADHPSQLIFGNPPHRRRVEP